MKTHFIKKLCAAALAVMLLAGLTGCRDNDNAPKLPDPTIPGETQQIAPTQQMQTESTAPMLDELVTVTQSVHLVGNDGFNDYDYWYEVPQINLSSADAAECNEEIAQMCERPIREAQAASDEGYSVSDTGICYEASLCDGVLTLLVQVQNDWGMTQYYICLLDVQTGEELDNDELFERIGMNGDDADDYIFEQTKMYFESSNASALEMGYADEAFYKQQLEHTLAADNLDDARLYLNTRGELALCVNIYGFAGADCYWYLIPTDMELMFADCDNLLSPHHAA